MLCQTSIKLPWPMLTGRATSAEILLCSTYFFERIHSTVNLQYLPDSKNASSFCAAFASPMQVLKALSF